MVASIVGDTITEIRKRMSSLRAFGNKTIVENINRHLLSIKEVAERSDATATPDWLIDVADAVTDLWDLLEDQDVPADAAQLPKQTKITSFFSLFNFRRRSLLLQLEKRLQHIAALTKLLLKNRKKLTNSVMTDREIAIVGRENEMEEIINKILALTKVKGAVPVVTILGMQGMGKTTLARFVCRDERVKRNFDPVIWINGIHNEFNAESIVKRMIHESATMKNKKKKELEDNDSIVIDKNLNLQEAMSGSRFFLVLDDFQNENGEEWRKLHQILMDAASSSGGAVLVTTRSFIAARVVSSQPSTWHLRELNEADSWTLFEKIAGGDTSESKITDAEKKMVNKCRGVPVAILTMARMLRSREAVTESEIDRVEEEFMEEMQLTYYNELPSWHLKQCFAYLSFIFSPTYSFNTTETLIRLWMAEGFLGPVNSNSSSPQQSQPEDLGFDHIQEFWRRSILRVVEDENKILRICSMNNELMLQLSIFVADKDRFCLEDRDEDVKETVRRVLLTRDFDVSSGTLKSLFANNKNLRTLLFPLSFVHGWSPRISDEVKLSWSACDAIFCSFKSLRVLNLADLGMKILPISIGELKSLRYLDLSGNNMKKLPNSIGMLKYMQTLILSHCHQLRELPNELKHLVSLRHLVMEDCLRLTHMPSALKKLTKLRTLSYFVASSTSRKHNHNHTRGIGELINLNNLRGKLEISHLERLKFKESDDGHAYLKEKQHLKFLALKWNHDDDHNDGNNHDQISLGHLEPHPNLERLQIVGYRGTNFSDWLSSLKNLGSFILYNCSTCKSLPPLDQFPKLKVLQLKRLDSLEYITDRDDSRNELGLGLKDLSISDCPKLTTWWKGSTHNTSSRFGSILRLEVQYCPHLDCMPLYPNLDGMLVLEGSSVKPLQETIRYTSASSSSMASDSGSVSNSPPPLSKLQWLKINNEDEQSPLPVAWLENFLSLQYLWISEKMSLMKGFEHLSSLNTMIITNCTRVDGPGDEWKGLKSLRYLTIGEVAKLKSLPEGIKHLAPLTELRILSCPELETLTEGIGDLKSLKFLFIGDCHKLGSLPKGMAGLTSLNVLRIVDCPLLLPRCQTETGDDWPQIKHIKDIRLTGTSEVYEQ